MSQAASPSAPVARLTSMDAYRGFVMALIVGEIMLLGRLAAKVPDNPVWAFLGHHYTHVTWFGCSLHDLIQPSFSFLVGVALPYSLNSRLARGDAPWKLALHAWWRALLLVLLGVAIRSVGWKQTHWTFEDTLAQIGLGYGFLFLVGLRPVRDQWLAFAAILAGYWLAFVLYPLPPADFDYSKVGVPADWAFHRDGLAAHWNKNSHLAWAFDTWFLNLFPRVKAFTHHNGGYATLNFIPTLATMILGLLAGGVLRGERPTGGKVRWLLVAGSVALVLGLALDWAGLCPIVKRIWTPSWVLFSGGWCLYLLAGFYYLIDIRGWRAWSMPLVVFGTNSIVAYCIAMVSIGFIARFIRTNFGPDIFRIFGPAYESLLVGMATFATVWLMLAWMHRRKVFLKI